ncbi:MAG: peptide-methionine (S)-S-oxide reductase MsrA [Mariprofundaceae bacterium]|nr:peptide-methionine (S)-S-oxide reductase MsrA [Mariprofundaceae bacterium]
MLKWLYLSTCLLLLQPMLAKAGSETMPTTEKATFAGGCFWCMEHPFDVLDGVISTTSGYIGGTQDKPTYRQVSAGITGHTEAVQVVFEPQKVSYEQLLAVYWRNIDPTKADRQFCDVGSQYRPGIFYHNPQQQQLAEASQHHLEKNQPFQGKIVSEITAATTFWAAEAYHQDYYIKNPLRYKFYRYSCGRDQRLEQLWGTGMSGDQYLGAQHE